MASFKFGVTPRMVVVIGETAVLAKAADITLTSKAEPDSAVIHIALENIDSSVFQKPGQYYAVQIYAGYLDEAHDTTQLMRDLIENGKYKEKLYKRFDGFVDQPEWCHGEEEMLELRCKDAAGLLMDGKFSDKKEGARTSAKSIISEINGNMKGLKVVFNAPDFNMGTKDSKGHKQTYSIAGKSYWDVIKDIAEHGALNIKKEATTITLSKQEQYKQSWEMIRTSTKDIEKDWSTYTSLKVRFGDKNHRGKEQVVVIIRGSQSHGGTRKKAATSRAFEVRYPKNAKGYTGNENTEFIVINWPTAIDPHQASIIAELKAKDWLRGMMTGNCEVPFANPLINASDGISFKHDKNMGLKHLDGKVFVIHSITETFSIDGYDQKIEFETNSHYEKKPEERLAPEDEKGTKPTGYSLTIPLGFNTNYRRTFGTITPAIGPGEL